LVPFFLGVLRLEALLADAQAACRAFLTLFFVLTYCPVFIGLNAVYKWGTTGLFYFLVWIIALHRLTLGRASRVVISKGQAVLHQGSGRLLFSLKGVGQAADQRGIVDRLHAGQPGI
jgi:hypothetical protein